MYKQKHNNLRELYRHNAGNPEVPSLSSTHKDAREIAVQTPEWEGDEPDSSRIALPTPSVIRSSLSETRDSPTYYGAMYTSQSPRLCTVRKSSSH
ncbi:hypothetical protein J6590_057513 [Homalodisca vitripennis]|nr:hypothetical protein J6590_057513 [Homalodisca vitripennis]